MIKADTNKATWEQSDVPAICEACLGSNPYIRMTRQRHGEQCKLCTRPCTLFRWQPDLGRKPKTTSICLTCARQKNCCQSCLTDLTYGLPLAIRDAALQMLGDSAGSDALTRQYKAQSYEEDLQRGLVADPSPRDRLTEASRALKMLAGALAKPEDDFADAPEKPTGRSDAATSQDVDRLIKKLPLQGSIKPPADQTIKSLFIAGIEDNLAEHHVHAHFGQFGAISSTVISHKCHCGFVNFQTREAAEAAAASLAATDGRLILKGSKLKLTWGHPVSLSGSNVMQTKVAALVRKAVKGGSVRALAQKYRSVEPNQA